jgi:hypothetical protein
LFSSYASLALPYITHEPVFFNGIESTCTGAITLSYINSSTAISITLSIRLPSFHLQRYIFVDMIQEQHNDYQVRNENLYSVSWDALAVVAPLAAAVPYADGPVLYKS